MRFITLRYLKRARLLGFILDMIMLIPRLMILIPYYIGKSLVFITEWLNDVINIPQFKIENYFEKKYNWFEIALERKQKDKKDVVIAEINKKGKNEIKEKLKKSD